MIKTTLSLAICALLILGCKSNKTTANTTETKPTESKVETPKSAEVDSVTKPIEQATKTETPKEDLYRFSVVFFSIGSGTENSYMIAFEDFIGTFSGKVGKNIDYEKTPWGREGETDYCLRLNELTPQEQVNFIAEANKVLSGAKWVHVYENQTCKHKQKR